MDNPKFGIKKLAVGLALVGLISVTQGQAQAQGQVWEGQQSHSTNSSNGVDQSASVYRLMTQALLKSNLASVKAGDVTVASLVSENVFLLEADDPCIYITAAGMPLERMSSPWRQLSIERSDNPSINGVAYSRNERVAIYLALANLVSDNFQEIKQKNMGYKQAEDFLIQKINLNFENYFNDSQATVNNSATKFYVDPSNGISLENGACHIPSGEINNLAGANKGGGKFRTTFDESVKVLRGPVSKWKIYSSTYQMNFDGAHISIAKNGIDWISASAINGKDLKLSDSAKRESSNSRSKTKNQVQ